MVQKFMEEEKFDFEGTTVDVLVAMLGMDNFKDILGNASSNRARWMSIQLGKIEAKGDGLVSTIGHRNRNKIWKIRKGF
jgi:hypothetical protein